MISPRTKGVFAIAPTPFTPDGALDLASLSPMTEWYLKRKVDGLTILGILGEAQKLLPEESETVVQEVVSAAAGKPVIVGVSAPGFAAMRRLALKSMEFGAAGVMMTPPAAMRTDEQITSWIRDAVQSIGDDVPFVLQDHPTATSVVMAPRVIRQIAEENPSCVMLKHEDWPGLEKLTALRSWQQQEKMRPLSVLCGNGGLFLDHEMRRGADGAMTGYAFPEMLRRVVDLSEHDPDAASDIFDAHLPLLRYEQQAGIGLAVRKYILQKRGAISHEALRTPSPSLSEEARREVDRLLRRLAVRDPNC